MVKNYLEIVEKMYFYLLEIILKLNHIRKVTFNNLDSSGKNIYIYMKIV